MSIFNAVSTVHSVQEISLDDATKLELGQIMTDTSPRQYRSDCQSGQFKIGTSTMKGQKLDMELIGAQLSEGEYFGYPNMRWLALLFADQEGVVSTILFKTESLDNFSELSRAFRLKGESLLGKTVRATMSKRASRATGNAYFAVEFEVVAKKGKFATAIAEFRQLHYRPEMIRLLDNKPAANQQPVIDNK